MALDVYIQPKAEIPRIGSDSKLVTQFEDEGYFVFLSPLFDELNQKTGQDVDIYGRAIFGSANLVELSNMITASKQLLELQPDIWDVWIGTQTSPTKREIYATVHKQKLQEMLSSLEDAVMKAKAKGSCIIFFGD